MGSLYIVPTPIGNLDDITLRAIEVLKAVDAIAVEDSRVSQKLFNRLEIDKPLIVYHEHDELTRIEKILEALENGDVALVSDAGMPGISDPGYKLIREVIEKNIEVIPLPGPNALLPALVGSGLPTDSFIFLGFLPKKQQGRLNLLGELVKEKRTLIGYESPFRVAECLDDVLSVMGNRRICIARELSKKFEEFIRADVTTILTKLREHELVGEVVLVIEGNTEQEVWTKEQITTALKQELDGGLKFSQAVKEVAQLSGWKRSQVYELGLRQAKKSK